MVSLFDTVEDFWALYNHIQTASGLNWGSDYYLFKERRAQLLDHYWLELLMAIIGEQFEDLGEYICGAVVNVRQKGDKVSEILLRYMLDIIP
ncbi:eukaryotic initiation factor 4E [Ancylostoma caninum]|uniref:Eukaryotic initiation factor 4E n=1 Tax=Ancylostoma caninum TaxID=29170 RepID=A0A368FH87_ANCCA|nr:eukaryotic initiation factor 4E [Ancylostoma caninum]